ncbi:hypothetical protein CSKR_104972 [Clonorchis sinensis]|uniref:Uncharacterized protein n=1 Tax=Clonorchis sinensis TaxID=79923 RepID=A0A3R7GRB3_CLOSI|nr:hypothetical protein CSKR_104972 [Clonorchis sinensis]
MLVFLEQYKQKIGLGTGLLNPVSRICEDCIDDGSLKPESFGGLASSEFLSDGRVLTPTLLEVQLDVICEGFNLEHVSEEPFVQKNLLLNARAFRKVPIIRRLQSLVSKAKIDKQLGKTPKWISLLVTEKKHSISYSKQ